jgi:N6-adenosine-specific RNA methylase IME4
MTEWQFGDMQPFSYDLINVDFPWDFKLYSENGEKKSARAQYDTMSLQEILDMRSMSHLAKPDSLWLIWTCEWMRPGDQQKILDEYGLTYKSALVWRKTTKNHKVRMGTGYRVRSMHERIILATTGNPKHKAFKSVFDGLARQHSRKPEEFYDILLKSTPGMKRADMFTRQTRPGFDKWGKQATLFDAGDPASLKRETAAPKPRAEATFPLLDLAI